jgi:hypothetical protein
MHEPEISVVEVGAPDTPAVIVFNRDANGYITVSLKGNLPPGQLIDCLEFVISNIRRNGLAATHIGTGRDWDAGGDPRYTLCGETLQQGDLWTLDPDASSCARCNRKLQGGE